MLRSFEKGFFYVNVKAKHLLLENKLQDMKTEWRRFREVDKGKETVSQGSEDIMHIKWH